MERMRGGMRRLGWGRRFVLSFLFFVLFFLEGVCRGRGSVGVFLVFWFFWEGWRVADALNGGGVETSGSGDEGCVWDVEGEGAGGCGEV